VDCFSNDNKTNLLYTIRIDGDEAYVIGVTVTYPLVHFS